MAAQRPTVDGADIVGSVNAGHPDRGDVSNPFSPVEVQVPLGFL
jgi:hypothetical protein